MYCIEYLNKKDYAVIDNAVELVKKLGKGGTAGFVNAFLRKFSAGYKAVEFPSDTAENISIRFSFPLFAVKELIKEYGADRTEKILAFREPVTTLSFYSVDGEEYLKNAGVSYEKTPFENVFSVKNFVRNKDYDDGIYTFQSIGSVAICDVVGPCEELLDCCAAPGGKSVRLSYKCGRITAFDIYGHRVDLINDYARRMRVNNIVAVEKDASVFYKEYEEKFDAVLCDAPCSGLGVAHDNPDIKLNRTEVSLTELNKLQSDILSNVAKYVKVGGFLYYSTCSILDAENIYIVEKFLKENDGYVLLDIDSKLPHENRGGAIAFLPDISMGAGFFVAKLKRIK